MNESFMNAILKNTDFKNIFFIKGTIVKHAIIPSNFQAKEFDMYFLLYSFYNLFPLFFVVAIVVPIFGGIEKEIYLDSKLLAPSLMNWSKNCFIGLWA